MGRAALLFVLVLLAPAGLSADDFYVSATGNDAQAGTSEALAWRTLTRANAQTLQPGDTLNFEGGATFSGTLEPKQCGAPGQPVTLQSYGTGRATLKAAGVAVSLPDCAYVTVRNLTLIGSGGASGVFAQVRTGTRIPGVTLLDLSVSGFEEGLNLGSSAGASGFDGLTMTNTSRTPLMSWRSGDE